MSECVRKVPYRTEEAARGAALADVKIRDALYGEQTDPLRPYRCSRGHHWHLTSQKPEPYWRNFRQQSTHQEQEQAMQRALGKQARRQENAQAEAERAQAGRERRARVAAAHAQVMAAVTEKRQVTARWLDDGGPCWPERDWAR